MLEVKKTGARVMHTAMFVSTVSLRLRRSTYQSEP